MPTEGDTRINPTTGDIEIWIGDQWQRVEADYRPAKEPPPRQSPPNA